MIDLHDSGDITVRLMGTSTAEMWGADLTGIELRSTFRAVPVELVYDAYRKLPAHKCGLLEYTVVRNARGRIGRAETMALPLINGPGRPGIAVAVTQYLSESLPSPLEQDDAKIGILAVEHRQWLDLGFGIPDIPLEQKISVERAVAVTRDGPEFLD